MPEVIGAIRGKWLEFGGEAGFGAALDIERPTFDGVGRAQPFAGGKFIVWHPELGPSVVFGAIAQKWLALGRERFGYPVTDELVCPDGRGRFNHFRTMHLPGHPVASIYWTQETGPHEVHGAIREAWARDGFERGPVGYPISDEFGLGGRRRRSNFEHGFIDWTPQQGAHVHGPVIIDHGPVLNPVNN
jgi:uncharacterized protein with LGFP repeats